MTKNQIFVKYLKIMAALLVASLIFFVLPFMATAPHIGKSMIMGFTPILFIALTWMAAAWWAWDKDRGIFLAVTMGGIPIRMAFGLVWVAMCVQCVPDLDSGAMFLSMMVYWIIFTIPEIGMLQEMSKKLEPTSQTEQ
jgi:hypothetical protein